MKRISYLLTILFLISPLCTHCGEIDFDFDSPMFNAAIEDRVSCEAVTASITALRNTLTLLDNAGIFTILDQEFYLRTNDFNKRSILDMPLFSTQWYPECIPVLTIYPFFNAMPRAYFTSKRDEISSYLAVGPGGFLQSLQDTLEELEDLLPDDQAALDTEQLQELFSLFENFSVEQRRLGLLFKTRFTLDQWWVMAMLPIIWHERNYIVDCPVQRALQEILDPIAGTPSEREQDAFQRQRLIADALGFGDMRIEAYKTVYETDQSQIIAGPLLTIPTSYIWSKGLYGSFFSRRAPRLTVSLDAVAQAIASRGQDAAAAQASVQAFALGAVNALSATLLDATVGNKHHIGLGVVMRPYTALCKFINRPWAEKFTLYGRTSLEYLLPKTSRIAFTTKVTELLEDLDVTSNDPMVVRANADLVEQTLTDRFYPYQLLAHISPGFIFRSANQCTYHHKRWTAFVGVDTYIQTAPTFSDICAPIELQLRLDKQKAELPWMYQSKAMVGVGYRVDRPDRSWVLGVQADTTYISRGLGKDSTIALTMNILF